MSNANVLELRDLTVTFDETVAVDSVSLSVRSGRMTGILGANGAGKTTTLLGIMGRVKRATGSVIFDGRDVSALNTSQLVAAGLALCPENRRLFPNMTIEDNLLLGAHGHSRKVQRRRLDAICARFSMIGERRSELAGRLSGGQQQIIAIARALMSEPRLLLLDEPSSGLSPIAIGEIQTALASIAASGTSVLLVEQNVGMVQTLCDEAYVLARGTVRDAGPVDDLLAGATVADAYLGGLDLIDGDEAETAD